MVSFKNETMKKEEKAINKANLDTSVRAGEDFFRYANGSWMKNNPIPPEYSIYGSFEALKEENNKQLLSILDEAAKNKTAKAGSIKQKIADFYGSGMDTAAIEKTGIKAIQPELDKINAIKSQEDFIKLIAYFHTSGISQLFYFGSGQDDKNSEKVIAQLYQGGLALPDRDYYLSDDDRSKEIRKEYVKHVAKTFELSGNSKDDAARNAEIVMETTRFFRYSHAWFQLPIPDNGYPSGGMLFWSQPYPCSIKIIELSTCSELSIWRKKIY